VLLVVLEVVGEVVVLVVLVVLEVVLEVVDVVVLVVLEVVGEVVVLVVLVVEDEDEYVEPLKVSVYEFIAVASCCPGELNSPTANPISTVEPTVIEAVGSCGSALVSVNCR
jgi:hypothetical protein